MGWALSGNEVGGFCEKLGRNEEIGRKGNECMRSRRSRRSVEEWREVL